MFHVLTRCSKAMGWVTISHILMLDNSRSSYKDSFGTQVKTDTHHETQKKGSGV